MAEGAEDCEVGEAALLLANVFITAIMGEMFHVDPSFHVEEMAFH